MRYKGEKIKNLIKRFLSAVLLVSFSLCLFVNGTTLKAYASDGYDFANITEEESLQFLEDHGIDIPDKFHDYLDIESFVKGLIQLVYYDPSYEFVFNYDEMLNFANEIKDNVVYYLNNQNWMNKEFNLRIQWQKMKTDELSIGVIKILEGYGVSFFTSLD